MIKKILKPYEALYPVPVVLVTSVGKDGKPNILTIAWTGTVSSTPPCVSISIRPSRRSFDLINQTKEFAINIPSEKYLTEVDYCGTVSGKNIDKFEQTKFTAVGANKIKPPLIKECSVNIECKVEKFIDFESHRMFIGRIVAVNADENILTAFEQIDYSKTSPIVYNRGQYWSLNKRIGEFGMSRKLGRL